MPFYVMSIHLQGILFYSSDTKRGPFYLPTQQSDVMDDMKKLTSMS